MHRAIFQHNEKPLFNIKIGGKQSTALFISFLVLGVAARIRYYLADLSLWNDEAALALSLTTRSFADLFRPLDYNQVAPIGFCVAEKFFLSLFGNNEFALRLLPLLTGIVALFLTFQLVKHFFGPIAAILCTAQLAVMKKSIFYATEAKPYASDLAFALALMLLASSLAQNGRYNMRLINLAVLGTIAVWFSFPSIFILVGIGCGLGIFFIRKSHGDKLFILCCIVIFWLLNLWIHFQFLESNVTNSYLKAFWNDRFMPLPPFSLNDLEFFLGLADVFHEPVWTAFPPLSVLMFGIGVVLMWRKNNMLFLWITIPIILNLIASALQKYPFGDRLLHYGVISLYLPIVTCMLWLWSLGQKYRWVKFLAGVLIVANLAEPSVNLIKHLVIPKKREQVRQVMEYIAKHPNADKPIFVHQWSMITFSYYQNRLGLNKNEVIISEVQGPQTLDQIESDLSKLENRQLVWMLFGHGSHRGRVNIADRFLDSAQAIGNLIEKYADVGAAAYLFDFSKKPCPSSGSVGIAPVMEEMSIN
jgi:hypothetical protein